MAEAAAERIDVGGVIASTYEVTQLIGRGGAGAVWAARHLRLPGKHVAIKVLLDSTTLSREAYERFRHEAEIVSRLGHPNIVEVLDFNELPNGTPYMVLELLKGESLLDRVRRGPLPLAATLAIARQIGSALNAAHKQHIVHRDLKPANIFLCPDDSDGTLRDHVKVLDFGISKIRDSETVYTRADVLMGTPRYMSPEQALGKNDLVDQRTDEFALAAIVYEMLSGRPAFPGEGVAEILMHVVHDAPTPLRDLMPELPAHVTASIARALEKDPNGRFADLAGFVSALTGSSLETFESAARPAADGPPAPGTANQGERTTLASVSVTPANGQRAETFMAAPLRRRYRQLAGGLAVGTLVLGVAALYFRSARPSVDRIRPIPRATGSTASDAPGTIAVMEFENQRTDDAKSNWYCKALQTAFNTELSKIPQLSVVAPEIIQRTAKEAGLDAMSAARQLGVNRFITGSFAVMGDTLRIDARIVETERGLQEAAENVEGNQEQFFSLQKQLTLTTLDHFRVRLTEAQKASLDKPTNARLDKYRMLLGAEGVTERGGEPAATPIGPQARPSAWMTPEGLRNPSGLAALLWAGVAYAQAPADSPEAAVREVLDAYRRAHEQGNLDELAALYVSFPASQREALGAYLKGVKQLKVELVDVKIQPREHDVAVSYTRRDNFIDKDTGEPVTLEVRVTKFLVQRNGQWKFSDEGQS